MIALACAAAIVFAALPGGSGPGEGAPGAPSRAWAAELVRFAEASPLVLLDVPGWRVDYADESSATEGEMRFLHGDKSAPDPKRLVVVGGRPIPKAVIEDARRHAELHWRASPIGPWKRDRANDAAVHTTAPVLGATADVYEYRAGGQFRQIRDHHDITALWKDGTRVMEFRWAAPSMAAFKSLLAGLRRVDTDAWLSAMPASVVKSADRGDAVMEMLRGIPLPAGFHKSSIPGAELTKDRYQLGAKVAGTVACTWIRAWSQARHAGDTRTAERAVAAMATAKRWPVLRRMSKSGDYPEVLEEYAAAMRKGHLARPAGGGGRGRRARLLLARRGADGPLSRRRVPGTRRVDVGAARSAGCRSRASAAAATRPPLATWRSCSKASGRLMLAIVDAGPLYATADADDQDHDACRAVLARADLRLVIPALAIAEATDFIGRRLGSRAEATFLRGLAALDVEAPLPRTSTGSPSWSTRTPTSHSPAPTPACSPSPSARGPRSS